MRIKRRAKLILLALIVILVLVLTYRLFHKAPEKTSSQPPVSVTSPDKTVVHPKPSAGNIEGPIARPKSGAKPRSGEEMPPAKKKEKAVKPTEGNWVLIDKKKFTLSLMKGTQAVQTFKVAVGKGSGDKLRMGDNRTPEGLFSVAQIQDASKWTHDFHDGKGVIKDAYGPRFIRLKCGWGGIGIHGTHLPESLGTRASEGCIRMNNKDVAYLSTQVKPGTPVFIQ